MKGTGNITIHALQSLTLADLHRVVSGYSSTGKYAITLSTHETTMSFELRLVALEKPYIKPPDPVDTDMLTRYTALLPKDYCFGAYDDDLLIGLIIAEPVPWNKSINVCEFHVCANYQNKKIGKQLMKCVSDKARDERFRIIVCETQNTNLPAIAVYQRLGFQLEGLDISYYSNTDFPDGEMAVFMKQRL